jgi:hypothetical protein
VLERWNIGIVGLEIPSFHHSILPFNSPPFFI